MNTDLVEFLKTELAKRLERNPGYSMRAFAKSLGVNIGVLSGLINRRRPLTAKSAEKLCESLGIAPASKSEIVLRALKPHTRSPKFDRIELEEDMFRAIADWYHWGILQLVKTDGYLKYSKNWNPRWIARQLQISEMEARLAVDRLSKLGLLMQNKRGYLERTKNSFTTANKNITSAALKKWQRQVREKAIHSLENDPIEVRSMTSMTMSIDPKKMAEAKLLIDEFQEKLSEFLEKGKKEKVYQLCVSLFPLQIREN